MSHYVNSAAGLITSRKVHLNASRSSYCTCAMAAMQGSSPVLFIRPPPCVLLLCAKWNADLHLPRTPLHNLANTHAWHFGTSDICATIILAQRVDYQLHAGVALHRRIKNSKSGAAQIWMTPRRGTWSARAHRCSVALMCNQGGSGPSQPAVQPRPGPPDDSHHSCRLLPDTFCRQQNKYKNNKNDSSPCHFVLPALQSLFLGVGWREREVHLSRGFFSFCPGCHPSNRWKSSFSIHRQLQVFRPWKQIFSWRDLDPNFLPWIPEGIELEVTFRVLLTRYWDTIVPFWIPRYRGRAVFLCRGFWIESNITLQYFGALKQTYRIFLFFEKAKERAHYSRAIQHIQQPQVQHLLVTFAACYSTLLANALSLK